MNVKNLKRGSAAWLLVGVVFCGIVGCGERDAATYPVTIKVAYPDGKPIADAQVVLLSADQKTTARGATGADGSCSLTTFELNDGAVVGTHAVIVAQPAMRGDPDAPYTGPKIASKFSNVETSGLEVTVTEDESKNVFPLTVTDR